MRKTTKNDDGCTGQGEGKDTAEERDDVVFIIVVGDDDHNIYEGEEEGQRREHWDGWHPPPLLGW